MTETNETITDIIAERRRQAEEIERVCADKIKRGVLVSEQFAANVRDLVADIRQEADRLEAALKREKAAIEADALAVGGLVEASRATTENSSAVGDAAKMRKMLEWAKKKALYISKNYKTPISLSGNILELLSYLNTALSAPPRNCDVGTAEEQAMRYESFCCKHRKCIECPCARRPQYNSNCEFVWAQMPYEEGGAK